MSRIEKTVFISYRRTNLPWAQAIFLDLTQHGYDVFLDYSGVASGDFESVILENIHSRAHFLVLLTPSALERCGEPNDWLRREVEAALDSRRNIVPLMLEGVDFGTPSIANQLTGRLAVLKQYNAIGIPPEYFEAAMVKLREKFLSVPLDMVMHPASPAAQNAAIEQKDLAVKGPKVEEDDITAQHWNERGNAAVLEGRNAANREKKFDDAIQCYNNAIRLKPDFALAFHNRGLIRCLTGDLDGAMGDSNEAIRLMPNGVEPYAGRGDIWRTKGHFDRAIEDYTRAIRLNADCCPEVYNSRGLAREQKGDLDGAIVDYNEALRLNPEFAHALNNRGVARDKKGDRDGAIEDLAMAVRLAPDNELFVYNLGAIRKKGTFLYKLLKKMGEPLE